MISLICVYNNKEYLDEILLKSLKKQDNFEFIPVDNNTHDTFTSASSALNHGSLKAKGKYLMFVHQDVEFLEEYSFKLLEEQLDNLNNLGMAGVAGKSGKSREVLTNILHGIPPAPAGKHKINEPEKVETIDECLMIVPRELFEKIQFDEEVCSGWHLYGVDYCLTLKNLNYNNYVLPLTVHHHSNASSYNEEYFHTLKKLFKKHSNESTIYTTMNNWHSNYPLLLQRFLDSPLWTLKQFLKRLT
ncbi:glycosyltransferase [Methanobacterium alcaliphilum]|uniref:glycosyltransferase n=1 Tax=Methanobacterium alcaliphilum TaxID=392018 RepID=UPI00200A345B|nr:glycosyltransferase [Methanobacterium alcaliphilum]MCK9150784.1 glycosyltransferase family protein [Methanobacterium alcaliphilum]